ncbi:MAG: MaoC family dehydratase N-terminal domain-containing protein [Rhodospirillales bacterium]|nr:MAG: MaoC family dehydratase N-terminal domain-containing protein [Rhodospirillales bacterium]
MRTLGGGLYYTDLKVGEKFRTQGRTIFEADLVNFISCTGMNELLFNNIEYIENHSPTKKRLVPGALVYSFAEGLLIPVSIQGTGMAFLSMSLDVKGPSFVGDTIHVECEVTEVRPTSKDPTRGLVRTMNQVKNQRGETVLTYDPLRMVRGRP